MAIPESQVETWAHQGATATAKATHEAIRRALTAGSSPIRDKDVEIYLQGSYKNDTNIRGDSDVDIVVQLNSTFQPNLSLLNPAQAQAFHQAFPNATYHWADFRRDALTALRAYFGAASVQEGNKSLKVIADPGRLAADVVPCLDYRIYVDFQGLANQRYAEGIVFYTQRERHRVINYPKLHYENGVDKNSDAHTNGWFKPTTRLFKNARTYLVDRNALDSGVAPSYFLESFVYNAPDNLFGQSFQHSFVNVLNWLSQPRQGLSCQNGMIDLFGTAPEQWSQDRAQRLVTALTNLWNNW